MWGFWMVLVLVTGDMRASIVRYQKRLIVARGIGLSQLNYWRSSIHGSERERVDSTFCIDSLATSNNKKLLCCFAKEVICMQLYKMGWCEQWIGLRKAIFAHRWQFFQTTDQHATGDALIIIIKFVCYDHSTPLVFFYLKSTTGILNGFRWQVAITSYFADIVSFDLFQHSLGAI